MASTETSEWVAEEGEGEADAETEAEGEELDGEQEARIAVAQRRTSAVCSAVNGGGPRIRSACCSSGDANRSNSGMLIEIRAVLNGRKEGEGGTVGAKDKKRVCEKHTRIAKHLAQ
jgi:hypothetical protein